MAQERCCTTRHSGTHEEYNRRRREYEKRWRAAHPGARARATKKWRGTEKGRSWRAAYKPTHRQKNRESYWRHVDQARFRKAVTELRRRARKAQNGGSASVEQVAARVAYWGDKCWMCGGRWEHIDHVKPLALGGTGWAANLRPACAACNTSKGGRTRAAA